MMRSGWAALAAVCLAVATVDGAPKKTPAAAPAKPKDAAADINVPRPDAKHVTF